MIVRFLADYKGHKLDDEVEMQAALGIKLAAAGTVHIVKRDPPKKRRNVGRIKPESPKGK